MRGPNDPTRLSYWYPKLVAAGLPVPKTVILKMPEETQKEIWDVFDGVIGHQPSAPCLRLGLGHDE